MCKIIIRNVKSNRQKKQISQKKARINISSQHIYLITMKNKYCKEGRVVNLNSS